MKKIIQNILFVCILIAGVMVSGKFIQTYTNKGIENVDKDTVDYVVLGDSEAYTSVSPMYIYNNHGFTGYNFGQSAQYVQNSYFDLLDAMKRQTPRVLLIETNYFFREKASTDIISTRFDYVVKNYLNIVDNHNGWKSIASGKKTVTTDAEAVNKGFRLSFVSKPYLGNPKKVTNPKDSIVSESTLTYLNKIMDVCKENNIKVIFYSAPTPVNWTQEKHIEADKIAKSFNVEYIDFNNNNQVKIDWQKDTYDAGDHINYFGAKKISDIIGQNLKDCGELVDRRNDLKYSQWVTDLETYKKSVGAH